LFKHCAMESVASEVFVPTSAYTIFSERSSAAKQTLACYMADANINCTQRWLALKKFSAALRYSALSDILIGGAYVIQNQPGNTDLSITLRTAGGAVRFRDCSIVDTSEALVPVILQAGNPANWFDLKRWKQLRPYDQVSSDLGTFPLSCPSYWDARYNALLERIGAKRLRPGIWVPPLATANDDMHEFLTASMPQRRGAA